MVAMAPQITGLTIVYSTVHSGADQRNHQSSASMAFVRGNHRSPVNSPRKWPVTRKMFPFYGVIMVCKLGSTIPVPSLVITVPGDGLTPNGPNYLQTEFWKHTLIHISSDLSLCKLNLTHVLLNKMSAISQAVLSEAFSWMKIFVFWWKFHLCLFLRVQLTTTQHWFR